MHVNIKYKMKILEKASEKILMTFCHDLLAKKS